MSSAVARKMGVLIHGCHLQAEEWSNIAFGNLVQNGRVTQGVMEAVKGSADLIFWGTGASQKKDHLDKNGTVKGYCKNSGVKESVYTYSKSVGSKLSMLAGRAKRAESELKDFLERVSFQDTVTGNTTQEIKAALTECQNRGIKELVLVSSPTHIARCLQEALKIQSTEQDYANFNISAVASQTCFVNSTPADVTILIPDQLDGTAKSNLNMLVRRFFRYTSDAATINAFQSSLESFLEGYDKNLLSQNAAPALEEKNHVSIKAILIPILNHSKHVLFETNASEINEFVETKFNADSEIGKRLASLADRFEMSTDDLNRWMRDSISSNVKLGILQDIESVLNDSQNNEIDELILFSSSTRIVKCYQEALTIQAKTEKLNSLRLRAMAANTCFVGTTPADVTIIEPPHRGDLPKNRLYEIVRRFEKYMTDEVSIKNFESSLTAFLDDFHHLLSKGMILESDQVMPLPPPSAITQGSVAAPTA